MVQSLLKELKIEGKWITVMYCDNRAYMYIATNSVYHQRTKHTELDCHFIREKIQAKALKTLHVSTQHQVADILTKPLFLAKIQSSRY